MKLHNLIKVGSSKEVRRRGRGQGTGHGGTSGRGHKGGNARSGYSPAPCCSGIPYYRRLPKRGFKNSIFSVRFACVNLDDLENLADNYSEISRDVLVEAGLVAPSEALVKILGDGNLTKPLKVTADAFSRSAMQKIEQAGGTVFNLSLSAS